MSPRKRITALPSGIHPDALPQSPGLTIHYDKRGKGRWEIRYYEGGARKSHKIGDGTLTLREIHAKFYEFQQGGVIETLEDLSNEFQKTGEFKELAPRTQRGYEECHKAIMNMTGKTGMKFGKAKLSQIKTSTIRQYRDTRAQKATTRAAHEVRYLKRLFSWAMEMEYMKSNPAKAIRLKKMLKPREHYVEDVDYLAALNILPLKLSLAAHLAYLTGRRRTDILELQRAQIASDGLQWDENKTGKATMTQWDAELSALVDLIKEEAGNSMWLFPGNPGSRYTDSAFSTAWKRGMADLAKQGFTKFQFKDLRAKYATDLELAGEDATENLVHGARNTTTRHYVRRKKVVSIGEFRNKGSEQ